LLQILLFNKHMRQRALQQPASYASCGSEHRDYVKRKRLIETTMTAAKAQGTAAVVAV
jgi:hypothetical protein